MTDKNTEGLIRFMLRNSNLRNTAISDENPAREIARNANKLSKSKGKNEKKSGMILLNMLAKQGNETAQDFLEDKSDRASAAAYEKHKETQRLKQEAMDHWLEHISPDLSNEAAAELLEKIVPLEHSTLIRYVSEFKSNRK